MPEYVVSVQRDGRVRLPKAICEDFGIEPGDRLLVRLQGNGIQVERMETAGTEGYLGAAEMTPLTVQVKEGNGAGQAPEGLGISGINDF